MSEAVASLLIKDEAAGADVQWLLEILRRSLIGI